MVVKKVHGMEDTEEAHYNADAKIVLKEFPHISMILAEIFENVN